MGRKRIAVDLARVIRLYQNGYSTRAIAAIIAVSHDTVLRRLKEAQQPLRTWRLPGEP
jgi:transposase-like protein